jgi:hypothetical protein
MSHWIEYQVACFAIQAGLRGVAQARYVMAIEGGPNNVTERSHTGRERRSRDWYIGMIGTQVQLLRQAVRAAANCEGGSLKWHGRTMTPEAYIGRARRLVAQAREDVTGHLSLHATVRTGHPLVRRAKQFGLIEQVQKSWGEDESVLSPPRTDDGPDWGAFFRAIDPFLVDHSVSPERLGAVLGLRSS